MIRMARWLSILVLIHSLHSGASDEARLVQTPSPGDVVVLHDDFDNPATSYFQTFESPWYGARHESGKFQITATEIPPGAMLSLDLPSSARDGTISVEAQMRNGRVDQYIAVGCRGGLNTFDAGYVLTMTPLDGYVGLYRRTRGPNMLLESTYLPSNAIARQGSEVEPLDLELRCDGTTLTGSVNGKDVVSANDDTFAEGYFLLETGVFSNAPLPGKVTSIFDNLVVSLPPEEIVRQRRLTALANMNLTDITENRVPLQRIGPVSGNIVLDGWQGTYLTKDVASGIGDFHATVQFHSPADAEHSPWDGLVVFGAGKLGNGYMVLVSSAGFWEVMDPYFLYIAKGTMPDYDPEDREVITVDLAVVGDTLYLRINNIVTVQLDVAGYQPGTVMVGSGVLPGNNRSGEVVYYSGLEVVSLSLPE